MRKFGQLLVSPGLVAAIFVGLLGLGMAAHGHNCARSGLTPRWQANSPAIATGHDASGSHAAFVMPDHQDWMPWLSWPGIHLTEMTPDSYISSFSGDAVAGFLRGAKLLATGSTNLTDGLNVTLPPGLNSPPVKNSVQRTGR